MQDPEPDVVGMENSIAGARNWFVRFSAPRHHGRRIEAAYSTSKTLCHYWDGDRPPTTALRPLLLDAFGEEQTVAVETSNRASVYGDSWPAPNATVDRLWTCTAFTAY